MEHVAGTQQVSPLTEGCVQEAASPIQEPRGSTRRLRPLRALRARSYAGARRAQGMLAMATELKPVPAPTPTAEVQLLQAPEVIAVHRV